MNILACDNLLTSSQLQLSQRKKLQNKNKNRRGYDSRNIIMKVLGVLYSIGRCAFVWNAGSIGVGKWLCSDADRHRRYPRRFIPTAVSARRWSHISRQPHSTQDVKRQTRRRLRSYPHKINDTRLVSAQGRPTAVIVAEWFKQADFRSSRGPIMHFAWNSSRRSWLIKIEKKREELLM